MFSVSVFCSRPVCIAIQLYPALSSFIPCLCSDINHAVMAPRSFKKVAVAVSGTFPGYKQGKMAVVDDAGNG